jgi:hypothetical protein
MKTEISQFGNTTFVRLMGLVKSVFASDGVMVVGVEHIQAVV